MSADLRRKLIFSVLLALLFYVALALWSDWTSLTTALTSFPWTWLPLVVGLTLVNYVGRLLKWQWYLRVVGAKVPRAESARIFGVGMLMVMTPGKAGEFLKSYMVKNVTGTPMSVTAPVILAERITDGMAMLLLAGAGLFAIPDQRARTVAAVVFVCFVLFIGAIQMRPVALSVIGIAERLPGIRRFAASFHSLYESSYVIFQPRNLLISLTVGAFNWAAEGLAYYVVLTGFGVAPGIKSMLTAVFIFNISTVIGAVFALPGGLGGVEGSMVALGISTLGLTTATATAAALLVRFCTLWFGVGIGVVSFLRWPRLLAGSERAQSERSATSLRHKG